MTPSEITYFERQAKACHWTKAEQAFEFSKVVAQAKQELEQLQKTLHLYSREQPPKGLLHKEYRLQALCGDYLHLYKKVQELQSYRLGLEN